MGRILHIGGGCLAFAIALAASISPNAARGQAPGYYPAPGYNPQGYPVMPAQYQPYPGQMPVTPPANPVPMMNPQMPYGPQAGSQTNMPNPAFVPQGPPDQSGMPNAPYFVGKGNPLPPQLGAG